MSGSAETVGERRGAGAARVPAAWSLDRPTARRRWLDRALVVFGVLGDILAVNAAMLTAYWIRFDSGWIPVTKGEPLSHDAYLKAMLAVTLVWLLAFHWSDMYRPQRWLSGLDEAYRVLIATALVFVAVMALSFLYRSFEYSRLTALIAFFVAFVYTAGLRGFGLHLARNLSRRPGLRQRVAVLGAPELARTLADEEQTIVFESTAPADAAESLEAMVREGAVDQVVVSRGALGGEALLALLRACEDHGAEALVIPDPVDLLLARGSREHVAGLPLLRVRDVPMSDLQRGVKRLLDIVVAAALLLVLSPLLLAIALAVRLTSPGPAVYRQTRITEGGRPFTVFKFRSMVQNAEAGTGAVWARKGDPRTTRIGRFLRRTSLDELPQIWNVLRGDMSLIGPRPERPEFVEEFAQTVPRYADRHRMKAGITGWAQVNGERGGDSSIERRTRFDLYYVDNWSLLLDLRIFVKTGFEVLFHRGAG